MGVLQNDRQGQILWVPIRIAASDTTKTATISAIAALKLLSFDAL
jgi:hypothetical protein